MSLLTFPSVARAPVGHHLPAWSPGPPPPTYSAVEPPPPYRASQATAEVYELTSVVTDGGGPHVSNQVQWATRAEAPVTIPPQNPGGGDVVRDPLGLFLRGALATGVGMLTYAATTHDLSSTVAHAGLGTAVVSAVLLVSRECIRSPSSCTRPS